MHKLGLFSIPSTAILADIGSGLVVGITENQKSYKEVVGIFG